MPAGLSVQLGTKFLWNRLVCLPSNRITHKIFRWDLTQYNKTGSWSNHVFKIFQDTNMNQYFESLVPCDLEFLHEQLFNIETANWNSSRYGKPKLRLYNMFKADLTQEDYFSLNIPKFHRSLFAQLRAGILPLQIEVGRFRNMPISERLCIICNGGEIEDEVHFVCSCVAYSNFRAVLFEYARTQFPDFDDEDDLTKFVLLMSNCHKQMITFTVNACLKRRSIIYIYI